MAASTQAPPERADLSCDLEGEDTLRVRLSGSWRLASPLPSAYVVERELEHFGVRRASFDAQALTAWDTGLLTFLVRLLDFCAERGIETDRQGLPEGARRLLALASAVPETEGTGRRGDAASWLARVGEASLESFDGAREMVAFVGEAALSLGRLLRGKARYRRSDLMQNVQECGANALPIVTLISVLVGLILAFVGAVQLEQFGAEIYVADLVGIGMTREMGAMMTAVIMAGRTGAAFAAQLGTMTVNEEIDALRTMAIHPIDFLVLPRMLALMSMMPLLTLYADLMGIVGGGIIGITMLDITFTQYYQQTVGAVGLDDAFAGLIKGAVFGVLVAIAGCMRGMQCGRSAQAVGLATTSAVVTGIVWVIVSDSILTVIYDSVGF